ERDEWYSGVLPDTIRLFRAPILDACSTYEEVVDEVLITVVHEVAQYFGIDDARLHELGRGRNEAPGRERLSAQRPLVAPNSATPGYRGPTPSKYPEG